jgi:hypothetical protein
MVNGKRKRLRAARAWALGTEMLPKLGLSLLAIALMMRAPVAEALTPRQVGVIAAKAKTDAITRHNAQTLEKVRASALTKAHADAIAQAKIKAMSAFSVRTEVRRRIEAAENAAKTNAQVTSFHILPLTHQYRMSDKSVALISSDGNRKASLFKNHHGIAHHDNNSLGGEKTSATHHSH